jgi:hypothetical protein
MEVKNMKNIKKFLGNPLVIISTIAIIKLKSM